MYLPNVNMSMTLKYKRTISVRQKLICTLHKFNKFF